MWEGILNLVFFFSPLTFYGIFNEALIDAEHPTNSLSIALFYKQYL